MKKILFSVFAVAAVMTACSKSDVVDAPNIDTPITFEAYSGKVPVTKAASIDGEAELASFNVYAYDHSTEAQYSEVYSLINGEAVVYDETTGWSTDAILFWPANMTKMNFIAYNTSANTTSTNLTYSAGKLAFNIDNDVVNQEDILVAQTTVAQPKSGDAEVSLKFDHILSRVYFTVVSDRPMFISSVELHGDFDTQLVYDFTATTNALTAGDNSTKATFTKGENTVNGYDLGLGSTGFTYANSENSKVVGTDQNIVGSASDEYFFMIAPSTDATAIKIAYNFMDEGQNPVSYTATVDLADFTFETGKSYQFKLVNTSSKIKFSVTEDSFEWGTGSTSDLVFVIE